jgi:hypothetical protein
MNASRLLRRVLTHKEKEMKKAIAVASIVGLAVASNAGLVDWSTGNMYSDAIGTTLQGGYYVSLVQDVDDSGVALTYADLQLDLEIESSTVSAPFPGLTSITPVGLTAADNVPMYTVIYDNADKALAGFFVVVDATTIDSGAQYAPAVPLSYAAGDSANTGTTVISGDWVAIPEPATLGLMGIAGLGMFLARRKARR